MENKKGPPTSRIREWKNLERTWNHVVPSHADCGVGVLLVAPKDEAERKALELAHERTRDPVILRPEDGGPATLVRRIRPFLEPKLQAILFEDHPCRILVALELDRHGQRLQDYLRERLEIPRVPWVCIATCENDRTMRGYVTSVFLKVRGLKKGGRPRKQTS